MIKGRIHSLESFGTLDGKGIRYVIFFQGCPLRCKFCHNPDTWDAHAGKIYTVEEIMKKIKRCYPYIKASGGGVTVSGGEPLMQKAFLFALLKACKRAKLHTTLDTCGYGDNIKKILKYTDYVMLSIKHANNEKHKQLTGVSNKKILKNMKLIAEMKPLLIRYVVIPGYTDASNDIVALAHMLKKIKTDGIELLPFYKLGEYKWKALNLPYIKMKQPTEKEIRKVKNILEMHGLRVL